MEEFPLWYSRINSVSAAAGTWVRSLAQEFQFAAGCPKKKKKNFLWKASPPYPIFHNTVSSHQKFFEIIHPLPGESSQNVFGQDQKCLGCF